MAGINKVILLGYMGADPEIRTLPDQSIVASVRLATSERWTDKNTGEKIERTEWHRIQFWNKQAEIMQKYGKKGAQLYVEGSLHTRKWTDQNGIERYLTEIKGSTLQFIGKPDHANTQEQTTGAVAEQQNNVAHNEQDFDDMPF